MPKKILESKEEKVTTKVKKKIKIIKKTSEVESKKLQDISIVTFKREEVYKKYFNKVNTKIRTSTTSEFIILLEIEKQLLENFKNINEEYDRKVNEVYLDVIRKLLENKSPNIDITDDMYSYYPQLDNPNFNKLIYKKKEFYDNKVTIEGLINKNNSQGFERSSFQKFVKNYISPLTPYNGVLLWHDVGVGKTCASIGIAENFRQHVFSNNKKIIILTPSSTLIDNWKNEIFSIEKERKKQKTGSSFNVQCTGNYYSSLIGPINDTNIQKTTRLKEKLLNQYYEFYGYLSLVNSVERGIKYYIKGKQNIESAKIKYIRDRFSNTVIIMDEIHVTRGDKTDSESKKSRPILEMICRYSENTKIILCSATPMFNVSEEIIWIINLLRWNDNKSPIEKNEVFIKSGDGLQPKGREILINKTRGYISYVRGENPNFFPVKIPGENLITVYPQFKIPNSIYSIKGTKIKPEDKFTNFYCYFSEMSEWQYNQFSDLIGIADSIDTHQLDGIDPRPVKASNIIFPDLSSDLKEDDTNELTGTIEKYSLDNLFNKIERNYNDYHSLNIKEALVYPNKKSMFHIDNIGKYSCKFESIMHNIQKSKGIVFIYSRFLEFGILPISIMLEENGFLRLGKENKIIKNTKSENWCVNHNTSIDKLTDIQRQEFIQGKYVYIDGSTPKDELTKIVNNVNGLGEKSNINGEYVKVILGSEVIQQGISFKNVREVHLLEPWFHLNQAKQASGRAIRNESHKALPLEKRNVIVFNHVSDKPLSHKNTKLGQTELIDEAMYRKAFLKSKFMGQIQNILKINSVDCSLNILNNRYIEEEYPRDKQYLLKRNIIDSQANFHNVNLFDTDYSENCHFNNCNYDCGIDILNITQSNLDTYDSFFYNDDIITVKEHIKSLYSIRNHYVYHEDEILESITELFPTIDIKVCYLALDNLIKTKEIIFDMYKRDGYLIERNKYYIFQPTLLDQHAPMSYRVINNLNYPKRLNLELFPKRSKRILKKQNPVIRKVIITKDNVENTINRLKEIFRYINRYIEKHYSDYPIDYNELNNIPTRKLMTKYMFTSIFERGFNEILKINILLYIANKINITNNIESLSSVEKCLYNYYYSETKFSYFITEKQIPEVYTKNDKNYIIGVIFPTIYHNNKYRLFLVKKGIKPAAINKFHVIGLEGKTSENETGNFWFEVTDYLTQLKYNLIKIKNGIFFNSSSYSKGDDKFQIYGNIGKLSGKKNTCCKTSSGVASDQCTALSCYAPRKFFLKYDSSFSIDKLRTQNKKEALRGAVCGSGQNATKKPDLANIVNLIYHNMGYKYNKYDPKKPQVNGETVHKDKVQRIFILDENDKPINDTNELENLLDSNDVGRNLCEEIELLLRHRDNERYFDDILDGNETSSRFFYKFEEGDYLKNN